MHGVPLIQCFVLLQAPVGCLPSFPSKGFDPAGTWVAHKQAMHVGSVAFTWQVRASKKMAEMAGGKCVGVAGLLDSRHLIVHTSSEVKGRLA